MQPVLYLLQILQRKLHFLLHLQWKNILMLSFLYFLENPHLLELEKMYSLHLLYMSEMDMNMLLSYFLDWMICIYNLIHKMLFLGNNLIFLLTLVHLIFHHDRRYIHHKMNHLDWKCHILHQMFHLLCLLYYFLLELFYLLLCLYSWSHPFHNKPFLFRHNDNICILIGLLFDLFFLLFHIIFLFLIYYLQFQFFLLLIFHDIVQL